jgi:hypothetical protein
MKTLKIISEFAVFRVDAKNEIPKCEKESMQVFQRHFMLE